MTTNISNVNQPKLKLIQFGPESLSIVELLSIVTNLNSRKNNTLPTIEDSFDSIFKLAQCSYQELFNIVGISSNQAAAIVACFELSRRKQSSCPYLPVRINSSTDSYKIVKPLLEDSPVEIFLMVLLNRRNAIIKTVIVSKGGIAGTVVDPKVVFKYALDYRASGIVLAHNHPSGDTNPSKPDLSLTKKLIEAGKTLEIQVLDHIIVSNCGYYSFADEGLV